MVRLGFRRALLCALAMSSGGLLLTLLPMLAIVIVGLTICSSRVFICQTATISFMAENVSEGRSLATGLYYMSYYAGGAVGTWIAGLAYAGWGGDGSVGALSSARCWRPRSPGSPSASRRPELRE